MEKLTQESLYEARSVLKREIKPAFLSELQWIYIVRFIRSNLKKIKILLGVIIAITLIEISIPIVFHILFERFSYLLEIEKLYYTFASILILAVFYIWLNYIGLKRQKLLVIKFINTLREDILKIYFAKSIFNFSDKNKGEILVKISYYFSLLSTGLNNSLFVLVQWVVFTIGLLFVTLVIDTKLLILSLIFIPVNLAVAYVAYIISMYYLSRDQTLYSQILRKVSDTSNNFLFLKMFGKEREFFSDLKRMVEIDSYFRVRREVMINLGSRIIFALLLVALSGYYIFNFYLPTISLGFGDGLNQITRILVSFFQVKLLYLSMRMGLFYFPLKLGLVLSVPTSNPHQKRKSFNRIESIKFTAKKVKLDVGKYLRNLEFVFEKGKQYLVEGQAGSGKSFLSAIFAGVLTDKRNKYFVMRINDRMVTSLDWSLARKPVFLIGQYFYSELPVYDILKNPNALAKFADNEIFSFIFSSGKFLGQNLNKTDFSQVDMCLIQILYCMVEKPEMVVIDNLWLDLNHPRVNQALVILREELSESIIIHLSATQNTKLKYDAVYKI